MSRPKLSPCPDRVAVLDDLREIYSLSERIDTLAMKVRDQRGSQDASLLSLQATICRLETAAQILRSLHP